jgi:hypothetical protein
VSKELAACPDCGATAIESLVIDVTWGREPHDKHQAYARCSACGYTASIVTGGDPKRIRDIWDAGQALRTAHDAAVEGRKMWQGVAEEAARQRDAALATGREAGLREAAGVVKRKGVAVYATGNFVVGSAFFAVESEILAAIPSIEEGCTCQGCGEKYHVDFSVPDEVWEAIKPKGKPEGAGLLCGKCIIERLSGLAAIPSPSAKTRTIHNPNPVYNLGVSRFDTWQVQVMANGEPVLTIGSNFLSGRDDIDSFADLVQSCGEHLLSFMCAAIPSPPKGCETKYRMLTEDDHIQKGDEFLEDDAETWTPVDWHFYSCAYGKKLFVPHRRPISIKAEEGK